MIGQSKIVNLLPKKPDWRYILIIILFLALRLPSLGYDLANSDSLRWHRRSERFLTALKQSDFKQTYQHYQPGVTLMWLNAFVKQVDFTSQLRHTQTPKTLETADYFPIIHKYSKITLVTLLAALLLYQMNVISRVFSPLTALVYGFIMSVEPYMLGIDRWFHLTSLETYFGMAAFLSLLAWKDFVLQKKNYKYLVISAVFFALAVLSKLTSLILAPILGLIIIAKVLHYKQKPSKSMKDFGPKSEVYSFSRESFAPISVLKHRVFPLKIKAALFKTKYKMFDFMPVIIFIFVFLAVFFVLFPALWVNPLFVFEKLKNAIFNAVSGDSRGEQITGLKSIFFYPLILLFKLSPILVALIGGTLIKLKKILKTQSISYIILYITLFLVVLTFSDQKIDRYVVIIIPALILVVSIFLTTLKQKLLKTTFVLYALFTGWLVYNYFPVYSSYYSPIFGENSQQKALYLKIYDNSGEYYAQAAYYLNSKGRDINTWVPYNIESFSYFYEGQLQRSYTANTNYLVTSINHLDSVLKKETQKQLYTNFDSNNNVGIHSCSTLEKAFGNRLSGVVFIFRCNLL